MRFVGILAAVLLAGGCEIFEDQTPEQIFFRMEGPAGAVVSVIYSKQFVAGVNEAGVTRVEVFRADTVQHVLPIDTVIDIRVQRQLYIQAEPAMVTDTLLVDTQVDVDTRALYDRSGKLFPTLPWRFLYRFNQPFTDDIEVII